MPRRELIERILERLPASGDSVAYPDHPLLLRGPDILASINGRLAAYFVLDEHVQRLPTELLSNVVLSRLALPVETSFVLILGRRATIRSADSEIFEEVAPVPVNELAKFPAGRMRESPGGALMESLRGPHNERFGSAWASTSQSVQTRQVGVDRPTSLWGFDYKVPQIRTPFLSLQEGRFILTSPDPGSGISTRDLLGRASNAAVKADYWLHLGVPGVEEVARIARSSGVYLAMHESRIPLPEEARKFDVLKPFRAAAFAGFAIRKAEGRNDI